MIMSGPLKKFTLTSAEEATQVKRALMDNNPGLAIYDDSPHVYPGEFAFVFEASIGLATLKQIVQGHF